MRPSSKLPASLALIGSLLGLVFAAYSTVDYANHLDRQIHNLHCSFIPGAAATEEADACRAALYSPYSALLKENYWGGVPISLFALGAFAFFAGFALYLLLANQRAPKGSVIFFSIIGTTPLLVSLIMLVISITQLGSICKTCAGIYLSSALLAVGAWLCLGTLSSATPYAGSLPRGGGAALQADLPTHLVRPRLSILFPLLWLAALGVLTALPASVYAMSVPDHRPYLNDCGELAKRQEAHGALVKLKTSAPRQQATFFEDPLCPTCKAFHDRLGLEGLYEKFDIELVLFPLDSSCNWMLDHDLHPGACMVSRAVVCADKVPGASPREVLDWAYAEQEYLTRAGKAGEGTLRAVIQQKWGGAMVSCVDSPDAIQRLNNHLHFAVDNSIPLSTPQVYLDGKRFCDEDSDIGLRFALKQRAPKLFGN